MKKLKSPLSVRRCAILERYGFDVTEYSVWRSKYQNLLNRCTKPDNPDCYLTFSDYVRLAFKAGLISVNDIGQKRNSFQLARLSDTGDYVKGNCRFITTLQNQREKLYNGGTAVSVEKVAAVRRGQTKKTNTSIASMAKKLTGRTAETHDYLRTAGLKRGKPFVLISPDGKTHSGMSMNAFCKKHGLAQSSMAALCAGRFASCKGWTGYYIS